MKMYVVKRLDPSKIEYNYYIYFEASAIFAVNKFFGILRSQTEEENRVRISWQPLFPFELLNLHEKLAGTTSLPPPSSPTEPS